MYKAVLYLCIQLYCIVFMYTAVLRISGALEQSTEVMATMQQLLKVEDISATMRELSQEMMKVCMHIIRLDLQLPKRFAA